MFLCSESDNVTLSLNDVSISSEGVYLCTATNSAGSGVARTYLDVTGKILHCLPSVVDWPNISFLTHFISLVMTTF